MSDRRLGSYVVDTDPAELGPLLRARGQSLVGFSETEIAGQARSELSVALRGLVNRLGEEMIRGSDAPQDVENMARCVRNIFETNLIIRYVCASPKNVRHWIALRVQEEIDLLRANATLAQPGEHLDHLALVDEHIRGLEKTLERHGIARPRRLPKWADLAQKYGGREDYDALYGLYSKYVHPSAWTIVRPQRSWDDVFTKVFVIHCQLYSADGLSRASTRLGLDPEEVFRAYWARSAGSSDRR